MIKIMLAKSAERSIFQQFELANLWARDGLGLGIGIIHGLGWLGGVGPDFSNLSLVGLGEVRFGAKLTQKLGMSYSNRFIATGHQLISYIFIVTL